MEMKKLNRFVVAIFTFPWIYAQTILYNFNAIPKNEIGFASTNRSYIF
jgi:hypothetical protein